MTFQEIVTYILGTLGTLALFFGRLYIEDLRARLVLAESAINRLGEVYLRKDEFKEFKAELWSRLDHIESTVESRLDTVIKAYSLRDFKEI